MEQISLQTIHNDLKFLKTAVVQIKFEINSLKEPDLENTETIKILRDVDMMEQISESERNIKNGNIKEFKI